MFNTFQFYSAFTVPFKTSSKILSLQLDVTLMVLYCAPSLLSESKRTRIVPVAPGFTGARSYSGTVQPQEVSTFWIMRSALPTFLKVNEVPTCSPCKIVPKSNTAVSNSILGYNAVSAFAESDAASCVLLDAPLPPHDASTITDNIANNM